MKACTLCAPFFLRLAENTQVRYIADMYGFTRRMLSAALFFLAAACAPGEDGGKRGAALTETKREGAALVANGEFESAIALLQPLSESASGNAQVFILLGDAYAGSGRPDDAVKSYEQSIRLAYTNYEAHLKLATVVMEQGKTGRALTEFEIAATQGKDVPLVHYNYGLALRELGRERDALGHWRRARALDKTDPLYAVAVGIGLTSTDPRAAVREFETAQRLGASGAAFDSNFGLALQGAGDNRAAEARFRAAVQAAQDSEPYRYNHAASLMRIGEWETAIVSWREMLDQFGEHWSYRVYLGRASLEAQLYQDALSDLADLTARVEAGTIKERDPIMDRDPPGLDEALAVLALAHRGLGDLALALDHMRRAVALSPDNPSHLNNYGVILAESGMVDDARAQWRRVLELRPGDATATENLSSFDR